MIFIQKKEKNEVPNQILTNKEERLSEKIDIFEPRPVFGGMCFYGSNPADSLAQAIDYAGKNGSVLTLPELLDKRSDIKFNAEE